MTNKILQIVATFDDDSKRFHRFTIDESQAVKGSIYILKGAEIPDSITIHLRTKADAEKKINASDQE